MRTIPADRLRVLAAALVLAQVLPPALARGAEPQEQVEVGDLAIEALLDPTLAAASLHEEQGSAAPAAVFVLTREDLRAGGFRTLAEALRAVPGLFTYSDGFYQYAGVRGTGVLIDYTTRLLVLIDGHPVNNTLGFAENSLGPDLPLPLGLVERIEVVKGPVGGVYGPTAFLGVVNLVTRGASSPGWEVVAEGAGAQGEALGGRVGVGGAGPLGSLRVTAGVEAEQSHGYTWTFPELATATDRPAPPGGQVAGMDQSDSQRAYLRADWQQLTLQAGCARWRRGLPSAPYGSIILDDRNQEQTRTCFAQVGLEQPVAERAGLELRLSYDHFQFDDYYAYEPPGPGNSGGTGPFVDEGTDRWLSAEARLRWAPTPSWSLTAGATGESHDTSQLSQAELIPPLTEDPTNGLGVGTIRKAYLTLNLYALAEWQVATGVALHAGLSWYRHELFGQRLSPRLAVVWRPRPGSVVKAIYAEGFRPPTAGEAFFDDVVYFIPNPELRPETVRSAELVLEQRFASRVLVKASLFRNDYQDLIVVQSVPAPGVPNPDPANPSDFRLQSVNSGALVVLGAEASVEVRFKEALRAYGGVSLQQPSTSRANFPVVTGNLVASSRALWRPLTLTLRAAFTGQRDKDPDTLAPGQSPHVGPTARLDAFATLEVPGAQGLSLEAGVTNLLDASLLHPAPNDFAPITEFPEPPRTVRLGLRLAF